MRHSVVRLVVGLVGLAAAVYGVATLTGGWLGVPSRVEYLGRVSTETTTTESWVIRDGGTLPGIALMALGLALVAFAAWPRRSKPRPPDAS